MARGAFVGECGRRISTVFFSLGFKKITIAICSLNLIVALFLLNSFIFNHSTTPYSGFRYTKDQIRRIEEVIQARQAAEPADLVNLVKQLKRELERDKRRWGLSDSVKQEIGNEILERLRGLNDVEQRDAVEKWRIEKLEEIKRTRHSNFTSGSNIPAQEAKMLKRALKFDWPNLLEDIGFWMPANVSNTEVDDKPENAQEFEEEEMIPGPPMPPECHAELHTDYGGAAVRWGLTHHKESAADCCEACLDQAKRAKPGEKKCNIWVYCPSEFGCYSPDIYEHKHQECWLKQADKPQLNFKNKYSEPYRNTHPTAPIVVPWMSGVVGA